MTEERGATWAKAGAGMRVDGICLKSRLRIGTRQKDVLCKFVLDNHERMVRIVPMVHGLTIACT